MRDEPIGPLVTRQDRFGVLSTWLPRLVFVGIACNYLLFAPNYTWHADETDTAYGADFLQEWVGARMLLAGQASELYNVDVFRAWQHDPNLLGFAWRTDQYFPPVYPPPHYALFTPLAMLSYRMAVVVWLLVLVGAAWLSAKLISGMANPIHPHESEESRSTVANQTRFLWLGLVLFPSLLFSITLGQKSVCWLLLICVSWRLLQSHRDYAAGMVFGILSIKPTLFFLLPLVMLRNGKWRFFVGASVSVLAIWGTTACFVPLESWVAFAKFACTAGSYAENFGYCLEWSCNLMTMAYSVPSEMTQGCKWAICIPLSIYSLYCVFEDRHFAIDSPEKGMMILSSTLLLSPHTYHYDICILLPFILCLATKASRRAFAYYGLLAIGVTVSGEFQEFFHLPILPILLIGMVCELRLQGVILPISVARQRSVLA